VKKVHSTGSVLDNKYTGQNAVLTKAKKTTHIQVTEEGNYERRLYFCHWFLQAVYDNIFEPKFIFFTDEAWFHLSGCTMLKIMGTGAVLIQDRLLKCQLMIRSLVCGVPLLLYE
jgi:hypothetical protein